MTIIMYLSLDCSSCIVSTFLDTGSSARLIICLNNYLKLFLLGTNKIHDFIMKLLASEIINIFILIVFQQYQPPSMSKIRVLLHMFENNLTSVNFRNRVYAPPGCYIEF